MKVITMINGSMIAESASVYALHYARYLNLELSVVHIQNTKDSLAEVRESYRNLETLAAQLGIDAVSLEIMETPDELADFTKAHESDMLFCSTKHNRNVNDPSFVQALIKAKLHVDIAVVKIVKHGVAETAEKIIMPIRGAKLSIKKFSLFSVLAKSYDARSEIYAVDKISKRAAGAITAQRVKARLQEIIFDFRHYFRLAVLMDLKFSLKHEYAFEEGERVKSHIAEHGYSLLIIGAHNSRSFFSSHPLDVLFVTPMINTIYFLPHEDAL